MSNKIQVRRGNRPDLPNPLDNGELGWCEDTRELYIGTGTANSNLKVAGAAVTSDFAIYCATASLGGRAASEGATGSELASGVTTGTSSGKLVNGNAAFASELAGRTVYNPTDDTWAKVTAVDSPTQLSLSADIMAAGEDYVIADAFDTIPEAFGAVPGPYSANVVVKVSPGTFTDDVTFVGKTASGNKTLTVQGSTTGSTTISGRVVHRQKLTMRDITFTGKVSTHFGADLEWHGCATSGSSKLYVYSGSANYMEDSTVTVGNDPTGIAAVNSTVTTGYTMYVASAALGGDDAVADGLAMTSGTATATATGKLVDGGAGFTAGVVGKTVFNSTDETWAKVTAVDSPTQLSLSADIMAGGEGYVVANAFSTVQKCLDDFVPGTINCDTTIRISDEDYAETVRVQNKGFSGTYNLNLTGTLPAADDTGTASSATDYAMGGAGSGASQATLTDTSKSWTVDQHQNKLLVITGGTGAGQEVFIDGNGSTTLTIAGVWDTTPDASSTYAIYDLAGATRFDLAGSSGGEVAVELNNQKGVVVRHIDFENWHGSYALYVHDFSNVAVHGCRFERSRTDSVSQAAIQIEGFSTATLIQGCLFHESGGTSLLRAIRLQQGAAPVQGNNIKNIKTIGANTTITIAALSFHNATDVLGSGWVIRNSRLRGLDINSFSRADITQCIITGTTGNNINISNFGYLILRHDCEISGATADGVNISGLSQVLAYTGAGSNTQINSNGGWGVSTQDLSFGSDVSGLSYMGNTTGTYTADASSKNT